MGATRKTPAAAEPGALRVPVLMYHHISTRGPVGLRRWSLHPRRFERHLRWLSQHGYRGVSVRDLALHLLAGQPLPAKPVAITFDDAYESAHRFALPLLQRLGFRATVYVVTSCIGGSNRWDQAKGKPELAIMSAKQLRHWVDAGFDLGSHSATHPDLTAVSDEQLRAEVTRSAARLQELAGSPPVSFAYPHGKLDERVVAAVRRVYRLAVCSETGLGNAASDPYRIPRLPIYRFTGERELGNLVETGRSGLLSLRRVYRSLRAITGNR